MENNTIHSENGITAVTEPQSNNGAGILSITVDNSKFRRFDATIHQDCDINMSGIPTT